MESQKNYSSISSEDEQDEFDNLCYKDIAGNYIDKQILDSPNDSPKLSKYKFSIDLPNVSNQKLHEYLNDDLINAIELNSNVQNQKMEKEDFEKFSIENNKDIIPNNKEYTSQKLKNKNNKLKEEKKENKKPFEVRLGDWTCSKCENLNFSFRNNCNRCGLSKAISIQNFYQNQRIMQQQNIFIPFLIYNNLNNMNYIANNYYNLAKLRYFNGYQGNHF